MNRHPRKKIEAHLAWLRTLPSLVRGEGPVEAAHVRFAAIDLGKRYTGMAERPDDNWAVPLAASAHRKQHSMNERKFWMLEDIHPLFVASFLWACSGDDASGIQIITTARSKFPWSIAG